MRASQLPQRINAAPTTPMLLSQLIRIGRAGWHSGNAVDLYSQGAPFESRPGRQLS
jgi:hypothetical protein